MLQFLIISKVFSFAIFSVIFLLLFLQFETLNLQSLNPIIKTNYVEKHLKRTDFDINYINLKFDKNNNEIIKKIKGVSILSKQSNSIIVSQNSRNLSLLNNKTLKKLKCIQSIHTESDLIEYYYFLGQMVFLLWKGFHYLVSQL